jgi:hypothetical protein
MTTTRTVYLRRCKRALALRIPLESHPPAHEGLTLSAPAAWRPSRASSLLGTRAAPLSLYQRMALMGQLGGSMKLVPLRRPGYQLPRRLPRI